MADGREAPPERPATSASSGPIAARRGCATARCSTPSAPRRRRTSCPGRHALAAARVAPPSRAAARRACGIGREAPGILKAGGAVEVHTMGSAPSAGGRTHSCCCPPATPAGWSGWLGRATPTSCAVPGIGNPDCCVSTTAARLGCRSTWARLPLRRTCRESSGPSRRFAHQPMQAARRSGRRAELMPRDVLADDDRGEVGLDGPRGDADERRRRSWFPREEQRRVWVGRTAVRCPLGCCITHSRIRCVDL
jgi:hypothetical protein